MSYSAPMRIEVSRQMRTRNLTRRCFSRTHGAVMLTFILLFALVVGNFPAAAKRESGSQKAILVEGFDSGTRVVREIAEALTGQGKSILECYPPGSRLFLWLLSLLSENLRIAGIEWGMSVSVGQKPEELEGFDVSSLPEWCASQYPKVDHGYQAIMVGSPNGGISHLAALLRAPFLTTSFGLTFRHPPIKPDELEPYYESGKRLAEVLLSNNAGERIEIINHYDPLHDRSLVRYVNFLRIKLLELPGAYQEFILGNLAPQGKIILINCCYRWPQYVVAERSFLQVGGLGGISPQEYLARWPLNLPLEERRESEWGCPGEFATAVKDFAEDHGIEVIEIDFDHPQEYGLLAYRAYLACEGVRGEEILFDCFNHQNPRTNIQTGIPGLWLPFNTEDCLAFARGFLEGKKFERIYLTLLPSFARSPDTATLESWRELLSHHGKLELLGINPRTFPADTLAPFRFAGQMRSLRQKNQLSRPLELALSSLEELL